MKLAIFLSGGGSNARVMIERFREQPELGVEVVLVVSNKSGAGGLTVAAKYDVPSLVVNRRGFYDTEQLLEDLDRYGVDFVALAGFLWLIPPYLVRAFAGRMTNIHPALLPAHGGKGMYGMNVHRAVRAAGEAESGMTIHYVNERYDEGDYLFQAAVRLDPEDTAEKIAARVLRLEHANYWRVLARLAAAVNRT